MIKRILFCFAMTGSFLGFGQDSTSIEKVSVEKSVFGIHTGLVGVWANNEFRLADQFTLRGEVGLELAIMGGSLYEQTIYIGVPVISAEPRWYYNLEKRNSKGKNITNNSGNVVSLKFHYYPDSFLITNNDYVNVVNQMAIVPKWSMRRVYGKHFTFETGIGIGPTFVFGKGTENYSRKSETYVDLHLRIGYTI